MTSYKKDFYCIFFKFHSRTYLRGWLAESVITTDAASCSNVKDEAPLTAKVNTSINHTHKEVNASVFTVVEKEHCVVTAGLRLMERKFY